MEKRLWYTVIVAKKNWQVKENFFKQLKLQSNLKIIL